jgi:hypothetical protein
MKAHWWVVPGGAGLLRALLQTGAQVTAPASY